MVQNLHLTLWQARWRMLYLCHQLIQTFQNWKGGSDVWLKDSHWLHIAVTRNSEILNWSVHFLTIMNDNFNVYYFLRAMWWHSWLRHCTTHKKVAGSIPDGVIGIFHWHNPSGRTMALGLTQPLTEMSTRNISWGVKVADAYGWQPYHLHVSTVFKSGSLNLLEPWGHVQACNGIALRFTFFYVFFKSIYVFLNYHIYY